MAYLEFNKPPVFKGFGGFKGLSLTMAHLGLVLRLGNTTGGGFYDSLGVFQKDVIGMSDSDEKVRSAYYSPKEFRRNDGRSKAPSLHPKPTGRTGQGWPRQTGGLSPWLFVVGLSMGFLLACLLSLLGASLFESGRNLMRPVAYWIAPTMTHPIKQGPLTPSGIHRATK